MPGDQGVQACEDGDRRGAGSRLHEHGGHLCVTVRIGSVASFVPARHDGEQQSSRAQRDDGALVRGLPVIGASQDSAQGGVRLTVVPRESGIGLPECAHRFTVQGPKGLMSER